MEKIFRSFNHYLLLTVVFLLPLFFLPTTPDFFYINKLYLLGFSALVLLIISLFQFITIKKIGWLSLPLDLPIFLLLLAVGLSIIISSPNKVQALLNPHFGLTIFLSLTVFYFYLSRISMNFYLPLSIASLILSLITIVLFFQPFKSINLPQDLQFLKSAEFNPIGSQLDLVIFLGFFVVCELIKIINANKNTAEKNRFLIFNYSLLTINLLGLSLSLYSLLKPVSTNSNQFQPVLTNLPPFRLSWYAAVEILKNPLTALFGVGVDNFSSIFTRVKDVLYNQSNLWEISAFNYSRSALLHLLTETGLFGLIAFVILTLSILRAVKNAGRLEKIVFYYLLLTVLLFPPSLIVWFLFFVTLVSIKQSAQKSPQSYDLSQIVPLYIITALVWLIIVGSGAYFLGRAYAAEYYFKNFLVSFNKNKGEDAYRYLRQAIISNPYIESYRISFSQLHLLIANNLAIKIRNQKTEKDQAGKQTEQQETDRQNFSQSIQLAISEAKGAVSLNPQNARNWENLAEIYRNIIGFTQGADVWTISAYQRAIVADPQNPNYRLNLGGVYYSLASYDDAKNMFQQTVVLKPDWPNAYYNLAWASYQKKDYQQAVNAMEGVLRLLDPVKNKDDYNKAKKELEDFKTKVSQEQPSTEEGAKKEQNAENLNLPSPIPTVNQPPIQLPKEASPEAK